MCECLHVYIGHHPRQRYALVSLIVNTKRQEWLYIFDLREAGREVMSDCHDEIIFYTL